MTESVLEVLQYDDRTAQRATWEGFEFTVRNQHEIHVTNASHENPEDHTYIVHIEEGIPTDCTCPAWEYREGACKHMLSVAIREPVLPAVTPDQPLRADGGTTHHGPPENALSGVPTGHICDRCNAGIANGDTAGLYATWYDDDGWIPRRTWCESCTPTSVDPPTKGEDEAILTGVFFNHWLIELSVQDRSVA